MDRLVKFILLVICILFLIYFPWKEPMQYDIPDTNNNMSENFINNNYEEDIINQDNQDNSNEKFNYNLNSDLNSDLNNNLNSDLNSNLNNDLNNNVFPLKKETTLENTLLNDEESIYSNFDKNSNKELSSSGAYIDDVFNTTLITNTKESLDTVNINKNNKKYNAKDFLPKEINDEWFDTDFSQAKHDINDNKLINTDKYIIGVNTVGQSLKNASYDIRGTVPNPKNAVSPWNNSTYEPDYNIKPLC